MPGWASFHPDGCAAGGRADLSRLNYALSELIGYEGKG
jgi:hypothetical protein